MADQIALSAEPRPGSGKGEARTLRNQGRVPAVAYGSKLESTPLHVDAKELRAALSTDAGENAVIKLDVGGDTHLTMPREVHRHPVRRDVLHLDFVAFDRDQKVTVDVPLHVVGDAPEGAIVNQAMNVITIDVLPLQVPDFVEASIDGLEIGDVIRAGDIAVPEGVDLLDDPERTAVSITIPDAEPVEETPEEAVEAALEGEEAGEAGEPAEAEGEGE